MKTKNRREYILESHWLGLRKYDEVLALQVELAGKVKRERAKSSRRFHLLLLEHEGVFTIGKSRDRSSLGDVSRLNFPLRVVGRGGKATCHLPGQLVAYPILDLEFFGKDLRKYTRALEEAGMRTLAKFDVEAVRLEGKPGLWTSANVKIASIGVGARAWISSHGIAINFHNDLKPFDLITPCGVTGVRMSTVHELTGKRVECSEAARVFDDFLRDELNSLAKL